MTTLKSLETEFRDRIGDNVTGAWQWQPEKILDFIEAGMRKHNAEQPSQEFNITGTGDDRAFSPDPTSNDLNLAFLYGELLVAESELRRSIRAGIKRTSPLASVDMTYPPQFWASEVRRIRKEIETHKSAMAHVDAMNNMEARHMSISDPDSVGTTTSEISTNQSEILLGTVFP